jgi:uncharacterized protein YjbI with pentapeptide repeats
MTSTAKNFAGQNLRGRSFKGQDLSGADFSGADLRGADFTDATLREANFSKVKTGVQKRWLAFHLIIAFLMSALSGFLAAFTGFVLALTATPDYIKSFTIAPAISIIIILIALFLTIVRQGFAAAAFGTVALAGASVVTVAVVAIVALIAGVKVATVAGTLAIIALTGASVVAAAVAGVFAGALVVDIAIVVAGAFAGALVVFLAMVEIVVVAWSLSLSGAGVVMVAGASSASILLVSIYVAWRTLKGEPKLDTLLKFAVACASTGGTSFRGADLRNVDFTEANLKSSDFRNSRKQPTNLTCTLWNQAKKLDRSRLGTSILANREVRELLITGKPNQSKSYEGLNLRGANLDGVYLEKVNFKRAILSEASFRNANLEWVNLTETQAIGTDFTGAQMTGVCLEGWSYDHTTKLDDVDCRFVFELEHPNAKGSRERRPHDPDKEFAAGDFTKRYSETIDIVQLLIRNGINREAFIAAWQKLTEEYPDISTDDIQEIKKKGQDVELTVAVPEDTDKGKFEHNFDRSYETKLREIEAKYQAQLESKEAMILLQKQNITDIKEILQIAKSPNIEFRQDIKNEAKAVAEQNPVTIKAGRDISGNVINLGEIKGNVTNAINQIPNKEDSGDIKTLLTQLQEAISADKDLADEDKADALEQVENLAKIALHDKPEEKSTLASKAIRALKRIIDNIPTISKIVETVGKALGLA